MSISLAVLQDLGIKLYSNVPSVLSEVVANAWDADAEQVTISIAQDKIVIQDDGHGMSIEDANEKYLRVGYKKRDDGVTVTPKHNRKVMGRKGIGKLSLFSIADKVEIQSMKGTLKHGFRMSAPDIEEEIKNKGGHANYSPIPLKPEEITIDKEGTLIILNELKKNISTTSDSLKKRIARRFSILGAETNFQVSIDGDTVSITDRDYFHKLQYLWFFGDESEVYTTYCENKLEHQEKRNNNIEIDGKMYAISGWIGSVKASGELKEGSENLNKVVVMMRGKLAQEDILEDYPEGGLYMKYLIGEIHADFLDLDDDDDIATTSRQEIIKDSDRYKCLQEWIQGELKHIANSWTGLRNEEGEKVATEIPAVKSWYATLTSDSKQKAKKLFGKINQLTVDSEEDRKTLIKHGVLAFESLRYKDALDNLDRITPENVSLFADVFTELEDIEATLYHQIIKERLKVIEALTAKVEANALEKVLQQHIFDNLWLLDPSWERATATEYMEQRIAKEFASIRTDALTSDEKTGRLDIKYRKTSGTHVIVELKRADRFVSTSELLEQISKYRSALLKILKETSQEDEPIDIICLVGKDLKDWKYPDGKKISIESLKPSRARVMMYQELIQNAQKAYKDFLDKKKEAGRVSRLIDDIDADIDS